MNSYTIVPYDVLFFRNNQSFHFGQWYTEGIFPPYPSTFQGFVRHKILRDNDMLDARGKLKDVAKAQGLVGDDATFPLDIKGPFPVDLNTHGIFIQTPLDVLAETKDHASYYSIFPGGKPDDIVQSDLEYEFDCHLLPDEKPANLTPPAFMGLEDLSNYRVNVDNFHISGAEIISIEQRVGINHDYEKLNEGIRTVQPGKFYVTPCVRMINETGFYCEVDRELKDGALKLGGESHPVYVEKATHENRFEETLKQTREILTEKIIGTKTFRIVLLQPGIFPEGWFPFPYNKSVRKIAARVGNLDIELVAAATGAPLKISGYSYAKNEKNTDQKTVNLKPMVNAMPAGSVYMFRIVGTSSKQDVEKFVGDFDNRKIPYENYSKMGFNHIIIACGR